MKILHLLASSVLGGAERITVLIINSLNKEYDFIYSSPDGQIGSVVRHLGLEYIPLEKLSPSNVLRVVRLTRPDIIHAHDYRASVIAASLPLNIPVVSHLHSNNPWAKRINLRTLLYTAALHRIKKVLLVSDVVLNEFVLSRFLTAKAQVVGNAVDIKSLKLSADSGAGTASDMLFVGRMSPEKNPLAFIDIVSGVSEKIKNVSAVMIGSGELEDHCSQKINELGLQENIKFVGFNPNPYPFMKQAKVVVVPSLWEGFGLVPLEAMILGIPVLCSPVGGIPGTVGDKTSGFLCDSLEKFITRSTELITDNGLWTIASNKAAERGSFVSGFDRFTNAIRGVYNEAVNG